MDDLPAWAAPYIGIPFRDHGREPATGWDCWGCARWIWAHHFGIQVPSFTEEYQTPDDHAVVAAIIGQHRVAMPWREVPILDAQPGDGVLLRIEGYPMHIAVLLTPTTFIHVDRRSATCLERLTAARWTRRVLGIFRYDAR